jgi:hypothetical protein
MIPKNTLKEWRKQALIEHNYLSTNDSRIERTSHRLEMCERVLKLTQELLNQDDYRILGVSTGRAVNVHRA